MEQGSEGLIGSCFGALIQMDDVVHALFSPHTSLGNGEGDGGALDSSWAPGLRTCILLVIVSSRWYHPISSMRQGRKSLSIPCTRSSSEFVVWWWLVVW